MPQDRNKIAQALSVEELDRFITDLAAMPGSKRTQAAIQHKAAELGIVISLESARTFRNTTFERHLANIRRAQNVAAQVEAIEQGGNTMADASAKMLSKQIFEQLMEADDEDSAEERPDVDKLSLAVARLRQGDVAKAALAARLRESEAKVAAYAAKEKERAEKAKAADAALQKLRDPGADLSESERAKIVATVDEVLGIRVKKKE